MHWKHVFFVMALSASSSATSGDGYVTTETDRFTQSSIISYVNPTKDTFNQLNFMIHAVHKGNESTARLTFYSNSENWKYLDCHDLKWLVDGKPLDLPTAYHKGSVQRRGVAESISQAITSEQLIQMGSAHTVDYRLCSNEGQLSSSDISAAGEIGAILSSLALKP
jgi:hypothetical protein